MLSSSVPVDSPLLCADDLRYPWPATRPLRASALSSSARSWALGHQLINAGSSGRFDAVQVGLLAALTYPGADLDRQELLAQFFAWIFLQDDTFDEPDAAPCRQRLSAHLHDCERVLCTGLLPRRACHRLEALKDIRDRIARSAAPAGFARFCRSMRGFWQKGVLAECALRDQRTPSAQAYLRTRLYSVGLLPPLDLADWAHRLDTPEAVVRSPELLRLRVLAAMVAALANDVFSFKKEQRHGDPNNLVLIRMRQHGHAEGLAVDGVVRDHNRLVARFERQSAALLTVTPAHPLLDFQIEACRRWLVGAVDWQRCAPRYAESISIAEAAMQELHEA